MQQQIQNTIDTFYPNKKGINRPKTISRYYPFKYFLVWEKSYGKKFNLMCRGTKVTNNMTSDDGSLGKRRGDDEKILYIFIPWLGVTYDI
jgi:hypothetical protein